MSARRLKILSGPNRGGNLSLPECGAVVIGADDACDLVLCDANLAGRHAMLHLDGEARLEPLDGPVLAEGRPLPAGGEAVVDFRVYALGDTMLCLGPDQGDWPDIPMPGLAASASSPAGEDPAPGDAVSPDPPRAALPDARRPALMSFRRATYWGAGLFAAASLLAAMAFLFVSVAPTPVDERLAAFQARLARSGFTAVSLERGAAGKPLLKGWVDTGRQWELLERLVKAELPEAAIEARDTRALAGALAAKAGQLGYTLRVIPERGGRARIRGYARDETVAERMRRALEPELAAFAGTAWEVGTWKSIASTLASLASARRMGGLRFEPRDTSVAVFGIQNAKKEVWAALSTEIEDTLSMPVAFVQPGADGAETAVPPLGGGASPAGSRPYAPGNAPAARPGPESVCGALSRVEGDPHALRYAGSVAIYREGSLLPGDWRVLRLFGQGVFLLREGTVYYCQW